jgi:hypothetical protein
VANLLSLWEFLWTNPPPESPTAGLRGTGVRVACRFVGGPHGAAGEFRAVGNPFKSRPSIPLLASVAGGVALGLLVVLSPIGGAIGFAPLPPLFVGVLMLFVVTYLGVVQLFKQRFYAASGWHAN